MPAIQSRPKTECRHNQDFSDIAVMSGQQTQLYIEIVSDFKYPISYFYLILKRLHKKKEIAYIITGVLKQINY
jgi:hypothetical protein